MDDAVQRAVRTFIQALIGSILTSGVLSSASTAGVVDWSTMEKAGISALIAGVVAVIALVQNLLENHGVVPTILKNFEWTSEDYVPPEPLP